MLDSTLRSVQEIAQTADHITRPMVNRTKLKPSCPQGSMGNSDAGDCRRKTLDPEEDLSLRPDFGTQGPFARLVEPKKKVRSKMSHSQSYKDVTSDKPSQSKRSFWPEELKRPLANAARKALQSQSANLESIPFTTTILVFLDRTSSYEDFCELLEIEGLKIERKSFAQQLLAAVPALQDTACLKVLPQGPCGVTDTSMDASRSLDNDIVAQAYTEGNSTSFDQGLVKAQIFRTPLASGFRDESSPRFKAPIANMVIQPPPIIRELDNQPAESPKPHKPHPVNRGAALEELDTSLEDSTGASLEVVQSALHEMENMIRIQKEKSKRADLGVSLAFTDPGDLDDENAVSRNHFKTGISSGHSESDLFFSDFEPIDTASNQQRAAQAIDARSNRRTEIKSTVKPTLRDEPKIYDYFGPKKNSNITAKVRTKTTLGDGHFARHAKRKEDMDEYAAKQKISRHEDAFDGQDIDLNLAADEYDQAAAGHPTTGGKGISDTTIRHWENDSAAQAYATPTDSVIDGDELSEPQLLYQYRVHLREWLTSEPEVEARLTELGPWHTVAEANAVAAESVQKPSEDNVAEIFRPGAWSYNFNRDENGMETHIAGSDGGYIEALVSRNIAPTHQHAILPLNAFTIPRAIYLVKLQRMPVPVRIEDDLFEDSSAGTATTPELMLATTLKACTILDLANKAAGQKWLELETKGFVADSLDDHRRARIETSLRKELRQMNENKESFDRSYLGSGERFHIWVEMVLIDGPRN